VALFYGVGLDARLGLPFDELRAAAREAAGLGFESLWTPAGGAGRVPRLRGASTACAPESDPVEGI
jgi:hypothetical protein